MHVDDLGATVTRVLQGAQAVPRVLHRLILFLLAESRMRVNRWQLKLLVTSLLSIESGSLGTHSCIGSRAYSSGSAYAGGCLASGAPCMLWRAQIKRTSLQITVSCQFHFELVEVLGIDLLVGVYELF